MLLIAAAAGLEPQTDGCPGAHVFFAPDSAQLDDQARAMLDSGWVWMRPMVEAGAWINIEGSADDTGPASYNLRLSAQRAEAVRLYYLQRGVGPEQLRVRPHGETRPLAEFDGRYPDDQVRAQNRYVQAWPEMTVDIYRQFFPPGAPIC